MHKIRWSDEENGWLAKNYYDLPVEELRKNLQGRSWDAIKLRAAKIHCNRATKAYFNTNVKKLLDDSLESNYWLGFLFADGHFSKNGRIQLRLALKDIRHVQKFASYIGGNFRVTATNCSCSIMDITVVGQIKNKYDIKAKKTYNPISVSSFVDVDKIFAMIIGFIDGDGNVQKQSGRSDFAIRIKVHSSWIEILAWMTDFLSSQLGINLSKPYINQEGCAIVNWSHRTIIRKLVWFVNEFQLPVLDRKWEQIKNLPLSKTEKHKEYIKRISVMLKENMKQKDIANHLGITDSAVSIIIKKNKLKHDSNN